MLKISKFVNKEELIKIKSKLEYVPEFWNLEAVLKKDAANLTTDDLNRLAQVKKDKELAMNLQILIEKIDDCFITLTSEESKMLEYILYYSNIPSITLNKISESEMNYINNLINKFDGNNEEEINKSIKEILNPFIKEYAQRLFDKTCIDYYCESIENDLENTRRPISYRYRPICERRY